MAAISLLTSHRIRLIANFDGPGYSNWPNATADEVCSPGQVNRLNTSTGAATKANATTEAESAYCFLNINSRGVAGNGAGDAVVGLRRGLVDGFDLSGMSLFDPIYMSDTDGGLDTAAGTLSKIVGRVVPGPSDQNNDKLALFDFTGTWDIAEAGSQLFSGNVTLTGGADLIFSGTTGQSEIHLTDNLADALSIKIAGGADFMVFTTTDSGEKIQVSQMMEFIGGNDIRFTGTTGQPEIQLTDNLADALSILIPSGNDLMAFRTTDSNEAVVIPALLEQGATAADRASIKGIYRSATVAVSVPSITDPDIARVQVDVSASLTMQPAVGDCVIVIPEEALPGNARLQGAFVSATDQVEICFGSEGGNVVGAAKNMRFLIIDLT